MNLVSAVGSAGTGWVPNVIAFIPPVRVVACLSMRDRMEITAWRERAGALGFDRLVIHEGSAFDPPGVVSFLSIYERGTSWARWGVTRRGQYLEAWCTRTGADIGDFASMSEALESLLASR